MIGRIAGWTFASLLLFAGTAGHAQDDGGLFNHRPPAAWPEWFVAQDSLGVTQWINSDEKNLMGGDKPDHWTYRGKSRLKPAQLVSIFTSFAKEHHFAIVDVVVPGQKMTAMEFDLDAPGGAQQALAKHHNYVVAIEATDEVFDIALNKGAP
jgi:hypothetical protein